MTNYRIVLRQKFLTIIKNDLTIGKSDNDLISFTDIEIEKFIKDNNDNIEKTIDIMINDYTNDNELYLLKDPLLDWITEYLYDYIDTN